MSPEITHKSDAGGVKPHLENEKQVIDAFNQIIENAKRYNPNASVLGIAVQKMVSQGIEVIIGIKRDPQFGPVITVWGRRDSCGIVQGHLFASYFQ